MGTGRKGPKSGRRGLMALGSTKVFIRAAQLLEGSLLGVGHEVGGDAKDGRSVKLSLEHLPIQGLRGSVVHLRR